MEGSYSKVWSSRDSSPSPEYTIFLDQLVSAPGAGLALVFGLVHGFGFAFVLKEFGLPQEALGWSLFSFNVGVELGQLAIVLVVASALALVRRRWPAADKWIVIVGSAAVMAAGAYWFGERVFFERPIV